VAGRITGDNPLFTVNVEKNVADILDEGAVGVSSKEIDAVIFSHHHWVRKTPILQFTYFPVLNPPHRTTSAT
jgi:hypothetical protein